MNLLKNKICSVCKVNKKTSLFYKRSSGILHNECRECFLKRCHRYYLKNQKVIYKRTKKYALLHQEESRKYKKDWYFRNRDSECKRSKLKKDSEPEKYKARYKINNCIKLGKIKRHMCFCGKNAEAHHEDYSRPLEIVWLCPSHHRELHIKRLKK